VGAQLAQQVAAEPEIIWRVGSRPQSKLISCPYNEIFFGGARGGGKTEGCLGEWLAHHSHCGKSARGMFVRHTLPQLEQVIERAEVLFDKIASYNAQKKMFTFHTGGTLKFRYLDGVKDAENYQGHEYTRIYVEEITNWAEPDCIDLLRACLRSPDDIVCKLIATGNPGGVGHTWVKHRYVDIDPRGYKAVTERFEYGEEVAEMTRVFIPSRLEDNKSLRNKAIYVAQLHQVGSPELVRAWLEGDWDIVAGAYFEGVWNPAVHIVDPFDIPVHWIQWRSMDWGTARPYAINYYAKSPDGVTYITGELYGWGGKPNVGTGETASEVASKVVEYELEMLRSGVKLVKNPADSSIWSNVGSDLSVEDHFRDRGVIWHQADKAKGSRINGAHELVSMLKEEKLKVFSSCYHWLRTVPSIPRSSKNPDDVDTDAEDHCYDSTRYGVVSRRRKTNTKKTIHHRATIDISHINKKVVKQKTYEVRL